MTDQRARGTPVRNQLLLVLMGIMLLYLVVSFVRQVGISQRRREDHRVLTEGKVVVQEENAALEETLDYVQSNGALEDWAYQNGWARNDQRLVVPVSEDAEPPPASKPDIDEELSSDRPRDAWWDLFFRTR